MKFRNGFVTNSSSTSFVVAFPAVPKNATTLKEMLFGDRDTISLPYDDRTESTLNVAKDLFQLMQRQTPNDRQRILEATDAESFDMDLYTDLNGDIDWYLQSRADVHETGKIVDKFMKDNADRFIYTFDLGNDGHLGHLEHGRVFNALPHQSYGRH